MLTVIAIQVIVTLTLFSHFGNLVQIDHRFFLAQLIEKYGRNGSISFEGFEKLYMNLGLSDNELDSDNVSSTTTSSVLQNPSPNILRKSRQTKVDNNEDCETKEELKKLVTEHGEVNEMPTSPFKQCLSPRELMVVYGLPPESRTLSAISFLHLCPAIIYELDQQTCVVRPRRGHLHRQLLTVNQSSMSYNTWLYASLSIVMISVSGLIAVAIVPLIHNTFYDQLINFLVALAVGTLLGDAFLHLIPHALESSNHNVTEKHDHTESIIMTRVVFLSVVFFFTLESVLKVVRAMKNKDTRKKEVNLNYISVNEGALQKELLEIGENHHHSVHSHSGHCHSSHSNTALMVVMGDGLHNLTDGLAIGVAFSGGLASGFATAVAVFTHELPHELGDFAVLIQLGMTVRKALLCNLVSSVLSFLGMVAGLIVGSFGDFTRYIYAFTAASFIYIALANLVPEIQKNKESNWRVAVLQLLGILCGGSFMGVIALFEHEIHNLFS